MTDTKWPYGYEPNTAVAVTGLILFLAALVVHIFFYFRHKSYFLIFLVFGLCMELLAMFLRIPVGEEEAAGFVAACWAPSIILAGIHMTLSRLIWFITPHSRLDWRLTGIPVRFIGFVFVALDLFALVIEILGSASYLGGNNQAEGTDDTKVSSHTMAFGLVIQAFAIVLFLAVCAIFAVKAKRWSALSTWKTEPNVQPQWIRVLQAIMMANVLVLVRNIFVMIETFTLASNRQSSIPTYLLNREWTFWVFDAVPIFAASAILLAFHPGHYIPRRFTGFRVHKSQLLAEKHRLEYGDHPPMPEQRPVTLFKDTEKTPATAYHLPRKVPRAYQKEERVHPAFA